MTDISVITAVPTASSKTTKFSKIALLNVMKFAFTFAALVVSFPEIAFASASSNDLMAKGNSTVKDTFGKDSSVVKWVILAEVLVGAVMYMTTKNLKFLAGFAILSVFITVGMSVAGY